MPGPDKIMDDKFEGNFTCDLFYLYPAISVEVGN